MNKSIDQLIEEELMVCEMCGGRTVGMSTNCLDHGGPLGDPYCIDQMVRQRYVQELEDEATLRRGWNKQKRSMPNPLKWRAVMNLVCITLVSAIIILVLLSITWPEVFK